VAPPPGFQPAQLEVEGGQQIKCWFNPGQYSIAKQNKWDVKEVVGKGLPKPQFGGGEPRKLSLDLLFDASDLGPDGDVLGPTQALFKMMEVNPSLAGGGKKNTGRPPTVTFTWGQVLTFKAVPDSLSVQYTLFHPDGRPIRAAVKLSLIQVSRAEDGSSAAGEQKQNPTTRGDILRSHVVRDGDSLASIAHEAYGDPTGWRAIAEANGIDDPLRLRRGTTLTIPRSPGRT
jgi:nucleoid-associated protein YgaU